MRVAAGYSEYPDPYGFKPYVYRGTGVDTLTAHMDVPPPRKSRRKPKPKPVTPQPPRNPKPENIIRLVAPSFQKPEPKSKPEPVPDLAPMQWVEPLPAPPPRPAPGWRPTSGAEIELLLAEMEEE